MAFKILCAAHDMGGGNLISTIAPLLITNHDYEVSFIAAGPTLTEWQRSGLISKMKTHSSISTFIQEYKPNLIITGSSVRDDFEQKIWSIADNLKIPTFAMIDGWVKINDRFINKNGRQTLPNILGVCDTVIAEQIYSTLKIPKNKIYVIGHPYLQNSVKKINSLRSRIDMNNIPESLVFLSSPIYDKESDHGITTFQKIVPYLERYFPKYNIIIRPHPREDRAGWIDFCANLNTSLKIIIDGETSVGFQLSTTKLLLGLPTTTILEGAFAGVPSLVLKFAINDYNNPATDYYLYNHTVSDTDDLENAFHRLISTTSIQKIIYDDLINYSINDSMEAISSIINSIKPPI